MKNKAGLSTLLYAYYDFNISFFFKFLSLILFGKIWPHNRKFYKMTEISQRGKLFYGYYNFNIYFFIIFGTNVVPKFEVSKLAVISHSGTLVHAYHDFNVSFFKILSFI